MAALAARLIFLDFGEGTMIDDIEERVRRRAYEIWERTGRPSGCEEQHWAQAIQEVAAEDGASEDGAASPQAETEPNLSTVAVGRTEATGSPVAPLSPGAANSSRTAQARRKDAT